jgi:hypothetical protein
MAIASSEETTSEISATAVPFDSNATPVFMSEAA